ncbi:methionine adenosyltransferase 2 subunit beta-like [Limulus polyphemus]|uniref:Methionine adenosyltransferase 2 subunit beta n=1 Tax=Limulus polyphemus TaxID=6850 RepID=A0ABM1BSE2_LIMPO|nr:methionine adenosyltransferase 2 subunit beta-like [Limulus polyphemus]XP_022255991.1 methionine adenosyltransferase 2 subunit beta-like [Limulus polyphemus]
MSSSSRKLLLTGASGLLGRAVHKRFLEGSWEVVGTAFSRATDQLVKLDLAKPEEVEDFVKKSKPSVLIHAAAQRYPDQVEKNYEDAFKLNVESSELLAKLSGSGSHMLTHITVFGNYDNK